MRGMTIFFPVLIIFFSSSTCHNTTIPNEHVIFNKPASINHTSNSTFTPNQTKKLRPIGTCAYYDFVVESVLMGFLCLVGFIGNLTSVYCFSKEHSPNTATPFLLISLAIADTLFLSSVFFVRVLTSVSSLGVDFMSSSKAYLAKYVFPAALLTQTMTIYMVVLVALNRFMAVCWRAVCCARKAKYHVLLVVVSSIIFNLPRFFQFQVVCPLKPPCPQTRLADFTRHWLFSVGYATVAYCVVMFLIPLALLSYLNFRLIGVLRVAKARREKLLQRKKKMVVKLEPSVTNGRADRKKSSQLYSRNVSHVTGRGNSRSEDDVTLTLVVIVMMFVVTQTPALLTQLVISLTSDESLLNCPHIFFFYERFSDLLVVANSSLNFLVYCFCNVRFRQTLFNAISLRCNHERPLHCPTYTASPTHNMAVKPKKIEIIELKNYDETKSNVVEMEKEQVGLPRFCDGKIVEE